MWISVDRNSSQTLLRQIYSQIKEQILNGSLEAGAKLPSTRELASELGVSRNTVLDAYDQLTAEGYLNSRHGSGTTVEQGIALERSSILQNISLPAVPHTNTLSYIDFRSGIPDLSGLPKQTFARLYHEVCLDMSDKDWGYGARGGDLDLRRAICTYLLHSRGLHSNVRNIQIVTGATQGLSLISSIMSRKHSNVIMEDPTHPGLRNVITRTGLNIIPADCDHNGLITSAIPEDSDVAFIYTTPSHQYPLGGILPIARRIELTRFAQANNTYIVEDDYDSEFRYEGQPVSTLYELDPEHVIYIGSFSKILSPALRLGYIIIPDSLIHDYDIEKKYSDVHTETITQQVLARFISTGGLEKHIRKMRKSYNVKRKLLIEEINKGFGDRCIIHGDTSGLHITAEFINTVFTPDLIEYLLNSGIKVYPVTSYMYSAHSKKDHSHELLMGYGHLNNADITKGLEILAKELS